MTKSIISVTCYQIGNVVHNPALTIGITVSSIRMPLISVPNTNPETNGNVGMVGANGEAPAASIAPLVYGCINVISPSNAGTVAHFVTQTVAAIIADINS